MNRLILLLVSVVFLSSCKSKKQKPEVAATNFFPVPAYVKGEVARLDTSLNSFTKIETVDGRSDTTAIRNSEVRTYAKDFLELPDIAADKMKDDYEVDHLYDDLLNAFVFTFTTSEDHPVRKEIVTVDPEMDAAGKNEIKTIFVELWQQNGDTAVRKNMLWNAGRSFQITTIKDLPGGTEQVKKLQVIWNGFEGQNR